MPTHCAAINSVHWLWGCFLRKKTVVAHNAKTWAVTEQLMSATKIVGQSHTNFQASFNLPYGQYILVCVRPGRKPQRHAFSLRGSILFFAFMRQRRRVSLLFSLDRKYTLYTSYSRNEKLTANLCDCTAQFFSDLVGKKPMTWPESSIL